MTSFVGAASPVPAISEAAVAPVASPVMNGDVVVTPHVDEVSRRLWFTPGVEVELTDEDAAALTADIGETAEHPLRVVAGRIAAKREPAE
jgi:hypothetical protein